MQWCAVWITTVLCVFHNLCHQVTQYRCVLELITTGADRDIETSQGRLVVDRDPVRGHVIEIGDSSWPGRDTQARKPTSQSKSLRIPDRGGRSWIKFIRIIDPHQLITSGFHTTDDNAVPEMRAKVDTKIHVVDYGAASIVEVVVLSRRQ